MKFKELFADYIDYRSSSIAKATFMKLLPKFGFQFQEDILEKAEINENFYEYEAAFKLTLVNYSRNLTEHKK